MSLVSQLFRGDSLLEAAAVSDPAHIVRGAKGEHVRKIQLALIKLDGAALDPDGIFGPATAAAVLAYKRKRNIVNRSYQSQADDIVGKMTIASLDRELLAAESTPPRIKFLSPPSRIIRPKGQGKPPVKLPFLPSLLNARVGAGVPHLEIPGSPFIPPKIFEMTVAAKAVFQVVNGVGSLVSVSNPLLATVTDPQDPRPRPDHEFPVNKDPHEFQVLATNPGTCALSARGLGTGQPVFADLSSVLLRIRLSSDSNEFTPGVNHNHTPCHDWQKVKDHPNSSVLSSDGPEGGDGLVTMIGAPVIGAMVRNSDSPREVVDEVLKFPFGPIARQHLDHYLSGGGRDFVEDENIRDWLIRDGGIRQRLAREVAATPPQGGGSLIRGHFKFKQSEYEESDFQNSFGAIDRIDFEADRVAKTLRIWFLDRYEWHPVYPPLYTYFGGDEVRPTNGIHAAFVEMKDQGAADYWMKGEFTVSL